MDGCSIAVDEVPARVDFAGGWLDVPQLARPDGRIANCTITPAISLDKPHYNHGGGVGGSASYAALKGRDPVQAELDSGCGWQDGAIVQETGLCVWQSGQVPRLLCKVPGAMLRGRMSLTWSGMPHSTPDLLHKPRDYDAITAAGGVAYSAICRDDYMRLCLATLMSYRLQTDEGMAPIKLGARCLAAKYCGSGWGGYILRMYERTGHRDAAVRDDASTFAIEPYIRNWA